MHGNAVQIAAVLVLAVTAEGFPELHADRGLAREVEVSVEARGGMIVSSASVSAEWSGGGETPPEPIVTSLYPGPLAGRVKLVLSPGVWRLTMEAKGFWAPAIEVQVPDDASPALAPPIVLWSSAEIGGQVRFPQGYASPRFLRAAISSPPLVEGHSRIQQVEVICPVVHGRWRCVVPAAPLDLRVSATDLVPIYLWDVVPRRGVTTVQDLSLTKGASVSGFVHNFVGEGVGPPCRVRLAASDGTDLVGVDAAGKRRPSFLVSTNRRGFFQVVGMPSASYLVIAEDRRQGRAEVPITVRVNDESHLEQPIELQPPGTLSISLDPPLSPAQEPWSVELLYGRTPSQVSRAYPSRLASPSGQLLVSNLAPGSYRVLVMGRSALGDKSRTMWNSTLLELRDAAQDVSIFIPSTKLCGTVQQADRPVQANLSIRVMSGYSTEIASDIDGRFCVAVPRSAPLRGTPQSVIDVSVESSDPPIARTVRKWADLSIAEAAIEVQLGDRQISGLVVDEQGRPAVAKVTASFGEEVLADVLTAEDGVFQLGGLPTGDVRLEALGPAGASDAQILSIASTPPDGELSPNPVRLVLRPTVPRVARITYAQTPVPGSLLLITPLDVQASPRGAFPITYSDGAGNVTFTAPAAARSFGFLVAAAGRPLRIGVVSAPSGVWREGTVLEVRVPEVAGSLTIEEIPRRSLGERDVEAARPFVTHEGYWFNVEVLSQIQQAAPVRAGAQLTLPMVEPGLYGLCYLTELQASMLLSGTGMSGCVSGEVFPGALLTLNARKDSASPRSETNNQSAGIATQPDKH